MSFSCKIVKVLSLLMMLLGIIGIVAGIVMFLGAPAAEGAEGVADAVLTARVLGAVFAATGAFHVLVGLCGAKGANNPSKLGLFIVLSAALVVVNLVEVGISIASMASFWQNAVYAAVAFVCVLAAVNAKSSARD